MTRTETRTAINEITKSSRISAEERKTLGDFIIRANEEQKGGDFSRARAVIDFLHRTGKISLEECFDLADLLG